MSEHYYQQDHRPHRHRLLSRIKWFFIGLLIALPIIVAVLFFAGLIFTEQDQEVTSNVQTSVQAPTTKIFRTPYFQFQTSKSWSENARESKEGKYVYQSFRGTLVEHEMTIQVNPTSPNLLAMWATHVQPVTPKEDGSFVVPSGISDHCKEASKTANQDPRQITYKDVTFTCQVDGAVFDVVIGQTGGTPLINMVRPDGSKITFTMYYRDLRAVPDGRELKQIVQSFQTR